jgi:hypothetical protein
MPWTSLLTGRTVALMAFTAWCVYAPSVVFHHHEKTTMDPDVWP